MNNTINIYCDESCVENNEATFMVIGALFVPRGQKIKLYKKLALLYKQHNHSTELKWNKVGSKYIDFYKSVIDYFVSNDEVSFRTIIVEKNKINYDIYHNNDKELAFYKFYYLLLKEKLDNKSDYYIFLDRKPTRDKNRARSLQSFLESHILFNRVETHIKHFQAYDSAGNKFIQLSDFLTGLISYSNNLTNDTTTKGKLVKYLEIKTKVDTHKTTPLWSNKLNIFKWLPSK